MERETPDDLDQTWKTTTSDLDATWPNADRRTIEEETPAEDEA